MKVLVVASTLPASESDPVPAFVKDQLIALKRLRPELEISVLAPHDRRSGTRSFVRRPEYDEYRFHYFWPFAAEKLAGRGIMPALKANACNYLLIPFLFIGEFAALLSLTRKLRPDVIYAHWFTPQGIVASWVGRLTHTPFVFTTHAADVDVWRNVPWVGRYVVRSSARRARAFTAVSRRSLQKLQQFFSDHEWPGLLRRAAVIPMGVDRPMNLPRPAQRQAGRTVLLFLGRLVEKKGLQYLLPAYAEVRGQLGESMLVIAGEGPMHASLRKQVEHLGLGDHVRFAGFVTGADKARLLEEADILVVPSIVASNRDAEGLPVALIEGLAYGKVCIATHESGADDVLPHGEGGFLVPQRDVEALSAALLRAASMDQQQRSNMQDAARQLAKGFDWEHVAGLHYEHLFAPGPAAMK